MKNLFVMCSLGLLISAAPRAQESTPDATQQGAQTEEKFTLRAQATSVTQIHNGFNAPYAGANSLPDRREVKNSVTSTWFLGARFGADGEIYLNPEVAMGRGVGNVLGLAGFPNGEISRVGSPDPTLYLGRLFWRQSIGLGGQRIFIEGDKNQLAGWVDTDRIVLTLGKMAVGDVFDANSYSHDARGQFLNWSLMANGAWDFPADARGYTNGLVLEYQIAGAALRGGVFMMPAEANGLPLDRRLARAHGAVVELEKSYNLAGQGGVLRWQLFRNRAHMGSYAESLTAASPGQQPDVTQSRADRGKYGVGLNLEQSLNEDGGFFARAGWSDGRNESFAFTEIDSSLSGGFSYKGRAWGRAQDVAGVALAVNALSSQHRAYLARGGLGFIVGDGRLNYSSEQILECYYAWSPFTDKVLTLDAQTIRNPAYNRDRGPVTLWSARLHAEF
jgi:hypothetical protein